MSWWVKSCSSPPPSLCQLWVHGLSAGPPGVGGSVGALAASAKKPQWLLDCPSQEPFPTGAQHREEVSPKDPVSQGSTVPAGTLCFAGRCSLG